VLACDKGGDEMRINGEDMNIVEFVISAVGAALLLIVFFGFLKIGWNAFWG
jgi:hypothetical protein